MKVVVLVPDDVFEEADRLARRLKASRSHLYTRAVSEFLARHAPDQVTDATNRVCDRIATAPDVFMRGAARRLLERSEW